MRILLGTDGSTNARIAEELLTRWPSMSGAEVICASVYASLPLFFSTGPGIGAAAGAGEATLSADAYETAKRLAADYADAAMSRLRERGIAASTATLEGDPGQELLDFAERNAIDLIAVGSRGQGAIESFLLGSAARKLVSHAPCHVLVGRQFAEKSAEDTLQAIQQTSRLSIAIGVDGSDGSRVAVQFVKSQGADAFAKIVAVCAEPLSAIPAGLDPAAFTDMYREDHERATQIAQATIDELDGCATAVAGETEVGRPSIAIGRAAARHGVQLILAGATRHGMLERFLIGSTSYELATEAPCPVLILRPPKR